jgi:hypothetical protein
MEYVMENDIIDSTKPFLDAGAGDGRILAMTACVFGVHSFGLEFDQSVVEDGLCKFNLLYEANIPDPAVSMILGQGDFTLDASYRAMDTRFEDMGTIFNFDNGFCGLAEKIKEQSPRGTTFLFKRITRRVEQFPQLKFVTQVDLTHDINAGYNLCIYQKE